VRDGDTVRVAFDPQRAELTFTTVPALPPMPAFT